MRYLYTCTDCGATIRRRVQGPPVGWNIVSDDLLCPSCALWRAHERALDLSDICARWSAAGGGAQKDPPQDSFPDVARRN